MLVIDGAFEYYVDRMIASFDRRIRVLRGVFLLIFLIFSFRLFDLQVLNYDEYHAQARSQHEKRSVLPARRGKILVKKNRLSTEEIPLATNHTLKMLFIDPLVLAYPKYNPKVPLEQQERGNPRQAVSLLAPLLIHAHCEKIEGCNIETDPQQWSTIERAAIGAYTKELEKSFLQIDRTRVILETDLAPSRVEAIEDLGMPGITIVNGDLIADPTAIFDVSSTAEKLSPLLNMDVSRLENLLARRPKRYLEITHKIVPEVSEKILELKSDPQYRDILRGVQLKDEHWRYYPERDLAAQILGFVDSSSVGQYGVEGRFDQELRGKEGYIFGAIDTRGQRILNPGSGIARAQDGADIVLSIDRVIQGEIEKILQEDLEKYQSDFGQIVVVDPKTGKVLAMAHAPSFDPNDFGRVFARYEISQEQEIADREDEMFHQRVPTVTSEGRLYRYFNLWGPEVFRNKSVVDSYEPGSVVKAVTMAAALNADEVTPQTTYIDRGPIEVDEFEIKNAHGTYNGRTTMIEVLSESLNTGIAFITQKMGAQLLYDYLQNFGFGQYTDIQLDGEANGKLEFWKDWSESELVTRGFGQGMTASPLQVVMAFSALANGGYLMKPILVEEIRYPDGEVKTFHPEKIRRVISQQTYETIKAMLRRAVSDGIARGARIRGYSVMGKTGTSQTYDSAGRTLEGAGTTITSFAGYGPMDEPAFVVLVKFDFPKTSQWGSETAAGTFRRVASFLFDHFAIPPDR